MRLWLKGLGGKKLNTLPTMFLCTMRLEFSPNVLKGKDDLFILVEA